MNQPTSYTAFADHHCIIRGDLKHVATAVKILVDKGDPRTLLVFADDTGTQVDLDLRGDLEHVLAWIDASEPAPHPEETEPAKRSVGRPRLGVVGREVTLLPRHWQWLKAQPGGASVALRKLVDRARSENADQDRIRQSREGAYRFMSAIAGNEPGFEEACRALFAGQQEKFMAQTAPWSEDVRAYLRNLAQFGFESD